MKVNFTSGGRVLQLDFAGEEEEEEVSDVDSSEEILSDERQYELSFMLQGYYNDENQLHC